MEKTDTIEPDCSVQCPRIVAAIARIAQHCIGLPLRHQPGGAVAHTSGKALIAADHPEVTGDRLRQRGRAPRREARQ